MATTLEKIKAARNSLGKTPAEKEKEAQAELELVLKDKDVKAEIEAMWSVDKWGIPAIVKSIRKKGINVTTPNIAAILKPLIDKKEAERKAAKAAKEAKNKAKAKQQTAAHTSHHAPSATDAKTTG